MGMSVEEVRRGGAYRCQGKSLSQVQVRGEQLRTGAEGGAEEDAVGRRTEDVSVHELPSRLLLQVLLVLLVVPVEVAAQRAHHDHRDDA
jgi:hypothetical protein